MNRFGTRGYIPTSCHNKLPQRWCHKITEIILSWFWRPKVGSQVVNKVLSSGSPKGKSLCLSPNFVPQSLGPLGLAIPEVAAMIICLGEPQRLSMETWQGECSRGSRSENRGGKQWDGRWCTGLKSQQEVGFQVEQLGGH